MSGNWHASRKALVGVVFSVCTEPTPALPARGFYMKDTLKITVALILAIAIPSGVAFASNLEDTMQNYQTQQQVQSITNGLSDISNSINTQTRVFQDALRQQQIGVLDPACVSSVVAQVRAKDGSVETQKMIDDYRNGMTLRDMSNPSDATAAASYLNYLYRYLEAQNTQLFNLIIQYCPKNVVPQVQQTAPSTNLQCNGKAWSACPTGQNFYCPTTGDAQCTLSSSIVCNGKSWGACDAGSKFYCPSSGDPQCIMNEAPVVTIPTTKNIQPSTEIQKPINNSKQIKAEQTTKAGTISEPAPTSYHQGLLQRSWSWFKSLFGF
jgi:hypothetical protein